MNYVIQQNVPTCPKCSALMFARHQYDNLYFSCGDCKLILKVIDNGQAEIELIVTDDMEQDNGQI